MSQNNAKVFHAMVVEEYKAMVCSFDGYKIPEVAENNLRICADRLDIVNSLLDDQDLYEKNMAVMAELCVFIRQYSNVMKD